MQWSEPTPLKIEWRNRRDPLPPSGMVAFGTAARELAGKLLGYDDDRLGQLQGVAAERTILLLGSAEVLPWVDGVRYLGRESGTPSILFPTILRPSIPTELFVRVLKGRFADAAPFAVLPELIIPFGNARPLSRTLLQGWLSANR